MPQPLFFLYKKDLFGLAVVVNAFNRSLWEAEAEGSLVLDLPGQQSKFLDSQVYTEKNCLAKPNPKHKQTKVYQPVLLLHHLLFLLLSGGFICSTQSTGPSFLLFPVPFLVSLGLMALTGLACQVNLLGSTSPLHCRQLISPPLQSFGLILN